MQEVIGLFGNTADACFAVDGQQRVVLWNEAAEALLGRRAEQVLGRHCFQVMRVKDTQGRAFCRRGCLLREQAIEGRLMASRRLDLETRAGQDRTVEMGTVVVPSADSKAPYLVHYVRSVEELGEPSQPSPQPLPTRGDGRNLLSALTRREHQILTLLAGGATTYEVAEELTIAPATARNHIQHLMNKLMVHSRLEAVVLARQQQLTPSP
ncbi:MAG: LuxR C-terminal-related transcriptional regulator [Dehalococcoidia bacterium]